MVETGMIGSGITGTSVIDVSRDFTINVAIHITIHASINRCINLSKVFIGMRTI